MRHICINPSRFSTSLSCPTRLPSACFRRASVGYILQLLQCRIVGHAFQQSMHIVSRRMCFVTDRLACPSSCGKVFLLGRRYTPVQLVGVRTSAVPLCWTALIKLMIVDGPLISDPLVLMRGERSAIKEHTVACHRPKHILCRSLHSSSSAVEGRNGSSWRSGGSRPTCRLRASIENDRKLEACSGLRVL